MDKIITTHSPEETRALAANFVRNLYGGEVIGLKGDLGAGKTTFVKGLATALGVDQPVRSPSYTLMNVYEVDHPTCDYLVHIDLYRLDGNAAMEDLELAEWIGRDDVLIVIEWPERIDVETTHTISFAYGDGTGNKRQIRIRTG